LRADLYPFESHWHTLPSGLKMHYLDEGPKDATPLVMVHGNPTWSFAFRELIKALRETHRVLVCDHIGCGRSDKPDDEQYEFSLAQRVADLDSWLSALAPTGPLRFLCHDWGGMIGSIWIVRHADRVERVGYMNTAAFHLPAGRSVPMSLKLAAVLVRGFNAFSRGAVRYCVTKAPLPAEVAAGYIEPYDSWANRRAVHRFVQDIPLSPQERGYELVSEAADGLEKLKNTPKLILWGEKDFVFDEAFLAEWRTRCPEAEIVCYPEAGHFVFEDEKDDVTRRLVRFFGAARDA
jgi:pimeloyl-ACP methyl ester carboxylesterase